METACFFGMFKSDRKVYPEIIPNSKSETLKKVIRGRLSIESIVITDGWRDYYGLVDVDYNKQFRVYKFEHFSDKNDVYINGIESFWSFTKRRLSKFNGVKTYFDLHLKECEWRWRKEQKEMEKELWKLLKNYDTFVRPKLEKS